MAIIEPRSGKVFPEHLYQGSKGPAVNVLALLLIAYKYGDHQKIVLDGDYKPGGKIAEAVNDFKRLRGLEQDGNFDPQMRREFARVHQLDFSIFTADMFAGEAHYIGPESLNEPSLPLGGPRSPNGMPDNWGVSG